MKLEEAAKQIKENWRRILPQILQPARKPVNGETSYICPFCGHGSHGDGLSFYPDSPGGNTLHCFGSCNFTGDVIALYEDMRGLDYVEAVKELAPYIDIVIDNKNDRTERPQTAFKRAEAETVQKSTKAATEPYKSPQPGQYEAYINSLRPAWDVEEARSYLSGRGFTEETARRFNLRYEPAGTFYNEANQRIALPAIAGPYNSDNSYYSLRSLSGKHFYKPNSKEAGEEPVYNAEALYSGAPCFICESQLDAISIEQAGGRAVACGGTGAQRKLLNQIAIKRPAAPLILLLDNDTPGQEAQDKAAQMLAENGIPYMIAQIDFNAYREPHKDANDLLRADPERLAADIAANVKEANKTEIERFLESTYTEKYKAVPTGVKGLDSLLNGGFIPQTLILISAEAGAGKTALCSQIFENFAEAGHPCIYLNLEMSREQMLARGLARRVYVKTDRSLELTALNILRGYEQTETTRERVQGIAIEYQKAVLDRLQYNPDNVTSNWQSIKEYINNTAAAAVSAGDPAPYICIDYLHIITGEPGEDTGELLKRVVFDLKEYAAKYDAIAVAIMAESRIVSRSQEATIQAGRDTSGLEYTADLQMQLKRDINDPQRVSLHVTKSRFTQVTMKEGVNFIMHGGQSYFEEADPESAEDPEEWTDVEASPFNTGNGRHKRKNKM